LIIIEEMVPNSNNQFGVSPPM